MQGNTDFMRKYLGQVDGAVRHWPSEEWIELLGAIQQSLGMARESYEAQRLVAALAEFERQRMGR
jgi:hypothetical protein